MQNIKIAEFRLGNYLVVVGEVGPDQTQPEADSGQSQAQSQESREAPTPEGVIGTGTEGASGANAVVTRGSESTWGGSRERDDNKKRQEDAKRKREEDRKWDEDFKKRRAEAEQLPAENNERGNKLAELKKEKEGKDLERKQATPYGYNFEKSDAPDLSSVDGLSLALPHQIQPPLDPIVVVFEDYTTKYTRASNPADSRVEPEPGAATKYVALYGIYVWEQTDQSLTYEARKDFERERLLPSEQNAQEMKRREIERAIKAELKERGEEGEELKPKSRLEPYANPHMVQKATDEQKEFFGPDVEKGAHEGESGGEDKWSQKMAPGTEVPAHSLARTVTREPKPGETKPATETPEATHSGPSGEKPEPTGPDKPKEGSGTSGSSIEPSGGPSKRLGD
jgi:hypothetical protein